MVVFISWFSFTGPASVFTAITASLIVIRIFLLQLEQTLPHLFGFCLGWIDDRNEI